MSDDEVTRKITKESNSVKAIELKQQLSGIPDDADVIFQGDLTFYRVNQRGARLYQVEFNEDIGRTRIHR